MSGETSDRTAIDPREFRHAVGNFVTGVTVVTTMDAAGQPRGFTANSFTSVSLDPPLVLICVGNTASSYAAFNRCHGFTVNILGETQRNVSDVFATKAVDKFEHIEWSLGANGAPRIAGCLATLQCRVHERVQAGDHMVLIGEVLEVATKPQNPLVYGKGGYLPIGVQQAAVSAPASNEIIAGCIAEHKGRLLLVRSKDGQEGSWTLPHTSLLESEHGELTSLKTAFRKLGAVIEIGFLYSVFDGEQPGKVHIVYRGELQTPPSETANSRLFELEDLPWDALWPQQLSGMLRRFIFERTIHQFGIYADGEGGGRVVKTTHAPEEYRSYLSRLTEHEKQGDAVRPGEENK